MGGKELVSQSYTICFDAIHSTTWNVSMERPLLSDMQTIQERHAEKPVFHVYRCNVTIVRFWVYSFISMNYMDLQS